MQSGQGLDVTCSWSQGQLNFEPVPGPRWAAARQRAASVPGWASHRAVNFP